MPKDFISDEEMGQLEKSGAVAAPMQSPDFISDHDMSRLEKSGKASRADQAFLQSYGNTALMGYLPHAQAAADVGASAINQTLANLGIGPRTPEMVDLELIKKGTKIIQPGQDYVQLRDQYIKRQDELEKDHPTASKVGKGVGIVGGALAMAALTPAAAASKAVTLGQKLIQGAKQGAALGALANPGDKEGEISLQPMERLKGGAVGAGVGAAATGVAELATPVASKVASWFSDKAERAAVKASGANKATIGQLDSKGETNKIGRELLDEGIVTPFSTPGRVNKRITARVENLDEKLTGLIADAESKLGKTEFWAALPQEQQEKLFASLFDPKAKAEQLKTELVKRYNHIPQQKIQPALDEIDMWFANRAEVMSPSEVQAAKIQMNRFLKDSDYNREVGIAKEGTKYARRGFKEGVEQNADALAEIMGGQGGAIKETNQQLGRALKIQDVSANRMAADSANRSISLTDYVTGAGMNSLPAKAAAMAINKGIRTFGSGMQAKAADAISKVLAKTPDVMQYAQKNPLEFQMLADRIWQRVPGPLQKGEDPNQQILNDKKILSVFEKNPNLINSIVDPKLREQLEQRIKRGPAEMQNPMYRRLSQ